ncbi:MAG: Fructose-2,6-bisphosphatase [Phormidium sp. OSCR]|nr:MAG: Fructose-2,6-bisphosphatase [Phormidium sp. OSCR]
MTLLKLIGRMPSNSILKQREPRPILPMTSKPSVNPSSERIIWIARHGHRYDFQYPEWFETASRRYDPPLSQLGLQQAQELAERLERDAKPGQLTIFSSPFRRCVTTAHAVAEQLRVPLYLEAGIGEWLNPDWMTEMPEIASPQELQAEFPLIDFSYRSHIYPQYPETREQECWRRCGDTARHLVAQTSGDVLFVGHGATVAGMTQGLLAEPIEIQAPCCSLVQLSQTDGGWRLDLKGDTSHLRESETQVRFN